MTRSDCTEPNRAKCPRLCHDFCNKAETEKANGHCPTPSGSPRKDWKSLVSKMRFGDFVEGLNRSEAANLRKAISRQINAAAVEFRQPDGTLKMYKTEKNFISENAESERE